ncbi:NADH-quinone oxidoreductase subunit H [Venenivibrio stagnispumantis]|uniref:Formate hydrogenlyase subunit 4 n=1 Tax=Venenivibrio stagnispumantis TaxID=407998 RepID=A0AA45WKF9_9AQUI|nr:NADH-quinone oxidoreductase subunit H [Venenivibrio stagnispumantis]MCW4573500.1 NADH-quinone oxidoreductase subunit H [Venenivibrio stagnispumantis]SMP06508.1 Formate hydrogenlyase subunit 4 [Venenivibrio stagnispumantis]
MENILIGIFQLIVIVVVAPFLKAFIHKIKAILRGQKGHSLFQPYRDIYKLLQKEAVISKDASFISRTAPYMIFLSTIWAVLFLPVINSYTLLSFTGDIIAVVYILAFGTFFFVLYGMDQASAFGGLGSSREITISSLAEPALMLIIFTFAIQTGSTNISEIFSKIHQTGIATFPVSYIFALMALFIIALAENGRIPIDNPETHLELTMVHEAMILEASGRHLALIEMASYIKLAVFITIASNIFIPIGFYNEATITAILIGVIFYIIKLLIFAIPIAVVEMSIAKFRFFRVPEIIMLGFVLSVISLILHYL